MSDTMIAPAAAPEAAVAVPAPAAAPNAAPATPAAPAAPAKPSPHELRSGALWRDDKRAAEWLGLEAPADPSTPPAAAAAAAAVATEPTPATAPASDATTDPAGTEPSEPTEGEKTDPKFRRAGERGPKLEIVGADGQPVALDVATVKVRTKAGGEIVELTLPELARKAASEVGLNRQNAHLTQQLTETQRTYETRLQETQQSAQQQLEQLAQLTIQALTDDQARDQLRARVSEYFSPEQQLDRERAAREAERTTLAQTVEQQRFQQAATGFYSQVADSVAGLEAQFPHVTPAELTGHFHALTAPITGPDGRVPPQFWPQLHAIVTQELPRIARERNAHIAQLHTAAGAAQSAQQQAQTLAAETTRAQQAAQQAVNQFARATRPAGTPGAGDTAPKKPAIRSLRDAQNWARQSYAGS